MNLPYRLELLKRLGDYMLSPDPAWQAAKDKASQANGWFIPEFINNATETIARNYLDPVKLGDWLKNYEFSEPSSPKKIGIVMAGNIPLVGFHDFLSVFVSGNSALIKASSKDDVLIRHLTDRLISWDPSLVSRIDYAPMLKSCDAYIATGSNNSARYFDQYFGKFHHIIRRNRTSVAILSGNETKEELDNLADDVFLYFGLGCRNVTKLYVPEGYDFIPLLEAFRKYSYLADHHKYKNNYDYNLAIQLLNKKYYMTNGCILLIEDPSLFSPISQLNYEFYTDKISVEQALKKETDIQCIIASNYTAFGQSQKPSIDDYADGVDTMKFIGGLLVS